MARETPRTVTTHPPMAAALIALALALTALVLLAAPIARADTMGFDARPKPGTPNAELGFFKFDADPGTSVQQVLVVTNRTDKAKTVRLAACDGLAAVFGGVAYSDSGKPTKAVGDWIELSRTSIEVPAGESVEVPFSVKLPGDASSGVHLGGIALWEPAAATSKGSGESSGTKATTKITMVTRMVLTVLVTTPGPAVPELTITGVRAEARSDSMYLLVDVANSGTGPTSGEGAISLPAESFQQAIDLGDMIPGSSTGYPIKWKTDPAAGSYEAKVELRYADGTKLATWSGQFTVEDETLAALDDRLVAPDNAESTDRPWLMYGLIGGLILLVLIMGVALLRRRQPRRAG